MLDPNRNTPLIRDELRGVVRSSVVDCERRIERLVQKRRAAGLTEAEIDRDVAVQHARSMLAEALQREAV